MLQAINCLLGIRSDLFEMHPNQNGTGAMVSNNSGFATLATFQTSQLLGFTMKLLDLPTEATHFLYSLRVVLRHIVCDNIVRALGGKHYSEKFHFMRARKALDFDEFAFLLFDIIPSE